LAERAKKLEIKAEKRAGIEEIGKLSNQLYLLL